MRGRAGDPPRPPVAARPPPTRNSAGEHPAPGQSRVSSAERSEGSRGERGGETHSAAHSRGVAATAATAAQQPRRLGQPLARASRPARAPGTRRSGRRPCPSRCPPRQVSLSSPLGKSPARPGPARRPVCPPLALGPVRLPHAAIHQRTLLFSCYRLRPLSRPAGHDHPASPALLIPPRRKPFLLSGTAVWNVYALILEPLGCPRAQPGGLPSE